MHQDHERAESAKRLLRKLSELRIALLRDWEGIDHGSFRDLDCFAFDLDEIELTAAILQQGYLVLKKKYAATSFGSSRCMTLRVALNYCSTFGQNCISKGSHIFLR